MEEERTGEWDGEHLLSPVPVAWTVLYQFELECSSTNLASIGSKKVYIYIWFRGCVHFERTGIYRGLELWMILRSSYIVSD